MNKITSLFVRKIINEVPDDIEKDVLLRSVGINPLAPIDPSQMVPDIEYYALLERIAEVDETVLTLPLRTGAAMRCDEYGALGLAWKTALNLQGSYERAVRFARVLTNVSTYGIETTTHGAFMHLHREGERRLGMRLSNEASLASIVSISRQATTVEFKPVAVFFKHAPPNSIKEHEIYFGCPVHFEADRDAILVSTEDLNIPNRLGDEMISSFFDSHLDAEVSKLEAEETLTHRVQLQIARSLSEGVPAISDAARHMGMSGRTLQRKLSDLGYTYQNLVDESRRKLAKTLLKETEYSLAEVAFMSGFSEQSAFTRAFKRWAGQTPRSYRLTFDPPSR